MKSNWEKRDMMIFGVVIKIVTEDQAVRTE